MEITTSKRNKRLSIDINQFAIPPFQLFLSFDNVY